jgi:hypothetical protein|tara:strand:- start:922 stop:1068 length:147 start_codon:yes stop_codon:yes gene_type:complete
MTYLAREPSGEKLNVWWQDVDTSDVRDKLATGELTLKNLHTVWVSFNL